MREVMNRIDKLWCSAMHERALWPMHGKYRCATCLREYAVTFEPEPVGRSAENPIAGQAFQLRPVAREMN